MNENAREGDLDAARGVVLACFIGVGLWVAIIAGANALWG